MTRVAVSVSVSFIAVRSRSEEAASRVGTTGGSPMNAGDRPRTGPGKAPTDLASVWGKSFLNTMPAVGIVPESSHL